MINKALKQISDAKSINKKIAFKGLKIVLDNSKPVFFKTIEDLEEEIKKINIKNVYKILVEIENGTFLQILVKVLFFSPKEINKPYKVIQLSRNINAFDLNFDKSSFDVFTFWNDLYKKIQQKIELLGDKEKKQLQKLVTNNLFKIT